MCTVNSQLLPHRVQDYEICWHKVIMCTCKLAKLVAKLKHMHCNCCSCLQPKQVLFRFEITEAELCVNYIVRNIQKTRPALVETEPQWFVTPLHCTHVQSEQCFGSNLAGCNVVSHLTGLLSTQLTGTTRISIFTCWVAILSLKRSDL